MQHALKGQKNGRKWEKMVGYSRHDLVRHLERQFVQGMSWDNMGEWQIDHIVPKLISLIQANMTRNLRCVGV